MFTFSEFATQMSNTLYLSQQNAAKAGLIVAVMWGIHILNICTGMRLNYLGLWPRHVSGLKGIIFSPFLHGDVNHLFFNTIPLFLLTDFTFIATGTAFWLVSGLIILISGLLTWIVGRNAIHVGASSLIMGYWGFLLTLAIYQPTAFNVIIVIVMLYYLSSLFLNLFPSDERVSFEGHICGAIAGILVALGWVYSNGDLTALLSFRSLGA